MVHRFAKLGFRLKHQALKVSNFLRRRYRFTLMNCWQRNSKKETYDDHNLPIKNMTCICSTILFLHIFFCSKTKSKRPLKGQTRPRSRPLQLQLGHCGLVSFTWAQFTQLCQEVSNLQYIHRAISSYIISAAVRLKINGH